jgi:hypothetical protein
MGREQLTRGAKKDIKGAKTLVLGPIFVPFVFCFVLFVVLSFSVGQSCLGGNG